MFCHSIIRIYSKHKIFLCSFRANDEFQTLNGDFCRRFSLWDPDFYPPPSTNQVSAYLDHGGRGGHMHPTCHPQPGVDVRPKPNLSRSPTPGPGEWSYGNLCAWSPTPTKIYIRLANRLKCEGFWGRLVILFFLSMTHV